MDIVWPMSYYMIHIIWSKAENISGDRKRKRSDSSLSILDEKTIKVTIEIGSKTYSGNISLHETPKT